MLDRLSRLLFPADPVQRSLTVATMSASLSTGLFYSVSALYFTRVIGLEATPEVVVAQELQLDWRRPARFLEQLSCPTLVVHGEADAAVPLVLAERIVAAMPNGRLEVIPNGGHRLDIRTPELVDPLLLDFLLDT